MYDFDLKLGYKNGFLAHSEAFSICPRSFNFIKDSRDVSRSGRCANAIVQNEERPLTCSDL